MTMSLDGDIADPDDQGRELLDSSRVRFKVPRDDR
jgi:hypothetical protein